MKPRTIGPLGGDERNPFKDPIPKRERVDGTTPGYSPPHTGTYLSRVADPSIPPPVSVRFVPYRTTTDPTKFKNPNEVRGGIVRGVDTPDRKPPRPRATTPKPGERFDAPCPYRGYQSVPATVKEVLTYQRGGVVLVLAYADREFTHTFREGATDKPITLPPPVGVQIIRNGKVYDPRNARTTQPTRTTIQTLTQSRGGTGYNGEVLN